MDVRMFNNTPLQKLYQLFDVSQCYLYEKLNKTEHIKIK